MGINNNYCEICKIFSNPNRLSILISLRDSPRTVTEIVKMTKISQSAVSQHLSMMRARSILESQRKGTFIQYKIRFPEIMKAFDIMRNITKKIAGESIQ